MNWRSAADQLHAVGLYAHIYISDHLSDGKYIQGGEYYDSSYDITTFGGGFNIIYERDKYICHLAGIMHPDPIVDKKSFDSLQEAVDWVVYKKRIELRQYWFMGFEPLKSFL